MHLRGATCIVSAQSLMEVDQEEHLYVKKTVHPSHYFLEVQV